MDDLTLGDVLRQAVVACGGSKVVAARLWPEKDIESARRLLADCLNADRPAHLTPEQALFVMRLARMAGHHGVMQYMSQALGYAPPVPVDPRDEADALKRQLLDMGRDLQAALARLEQIERPAMRVVG